MIPQEHFSVAELAKQLQKLALDPEALSAAATRAHGVGRPNATRDLADLVERTGGAPTMDVIRIGAAKTRTKAGFAGAANREGEG